MNHISLKQLQEYADGVSSSADEASIRSHTIACAECNSRLKTLKQIDLALTSLPREHLSDDFTQRVMTSLRIEESPSLFWIFLINFAPMAALTMVMGIVYAVLYYTGALQSNQSSIAGVQGIYQTAAESLSGKVQMFNGWFGTYFAFAKNSIGLTSFLVVFFVGIALLDKFLLMPMFRKRA